VIVICVLLLLSLSAILTPKFLYYLDVLTPEQETFTDFYDLPENSTDVVFLGSSHIYNGINPVVFYEKTGFTAYDLAFSSLDIGSSYYMLEEMYRFQSPKYVVLDCYYLTSAVFKNDKVYNRITAYMKWSDIKYNYIQEWLDRDPDKTFIEKIFPVYAYHQRWSDLSYKDFLYEDYQYVVMGYIPSGKTRTYSRDSYYEEYEFNSIPEETYEYLQKIVALCQEHGSTLIMTSIPYQGAREALTEGIQAIADEMGLIYLDYNEETLFDSIGLDLECDFLNANHLNTYGAVKMTQTFAMWFLENMTVENPCAKDQKVSELWNAEVTQWERDESMYLLLRCVDFNLYLPLLEDDRYVVFMTTKSFSADALSEEQQQQLKELGCTCSFDEDNGAYMGIYQSGLALEQANNTDINTIEGEIDGISYYIFADGSNCNIVIDGIEYGIDNSGLNFVVYDTVTERVIDAVCFNTSNNLKASGSNR